ncbi:hypothetical protein GGQ97_001535 [Sphingomonas kaistensis]|uniref:Uncharacterized protein n=1 Tax=Sphingomonas kaistensis TaxID=298708 RepID=A0A7X5Y5Y4_9SPHN|nr:hypothetical protein [Sphingomonas kaistensis]NJC05742.1 hypothetical protein [Sphingomonas kaistensis]
MRELERAVHSQLGSGIAVSEHELAEGLAPLRTSDEKTHALLDELWGIFRLYQAAKITHEVKEKRFENRLHDARESCETLLESLGFHEDEAVDQSIVRLHSLGMVRNIPDPCEAVAKFDRHLEWLSELEARLDPNSRPANIELTHDAIEEWSGTAWQSAKGILEALGYDPEKTYHKYDERLSLLGVDGSLSSYPNQELSSPGYLRWISDLLVRLRRAARVQARQQENLTGRKDHQRFLRGRLAECYKKFWYDPSFSISKDGQVSLTPAFLTFALAVFGCFTAKPTNRNSLKAAYLSDRGHKSSSLFSAPSKTLDQLRAEVRKRLTPSA